ncbi:MAG: LEPR-XLL domain-containing protein, partial [Chthoniobacteraceae bacterium]
MKPNRPTPANLFELQALEPRVLLSADLLVAGAQDAHETRPGNATDEVVLDTQQAAQIGAKSDVVSYDPAAQVDDIFAGFDVAPSSVDAPELLDAETAGDGVDNGVAVPGAEAVESAADSAVNSDESLGDSATDDDARGDLISALESLLADADEQPATAAESPATEASPKSATSVLEATVATVQPLPTAAAASAETDSQIAPESLGADVANPLTKELTETLKAANAPPASGASASVDEPSQTNPATGGDSAEAFVFLGSRPLALDAAENGTESAPAAGINFQLFADQPLIPNGVLTIEFGSRLSGSGTVIGSVINLGLVSPGNSPGIQTVTGDLVFAHSGTTLIEIGGITPGPGTPTVDDGFDQINVSGKATFGGLLDVQFINGFTPTAGQTFDIITYGSSADAFDTFSGLHLGGGLFLRPVFGSGKLMLEVVDATAALGAFAQDAFTRLNAIVRDVNLASEGALQSLLAGLRQSAVALSNGTTLTHTFTTATGDVTVSLGVDGSGAFEKLLIGATDINVLAGVGASTPAPGDDKGVSLSGGKLGFVLYSGQTYALDVSGTAAILGVTGLNFTGTLALRSNTAAAVDESITVGAQTVTLKFVAGAPFVFGGSPTLTTPLVSISGDFAVQAGGGEVFIGASGVSAFAGNAGVGISLSGGTLGLVILSNQTYAFDASGSAALVGVADVTVAGTLSVQKNTTAGPVQRSVIAGPVTHTLDLASGVSRVAGSLEFGIAGFALGGDFTFTQGVSPALAVTAGNVRLALGTPTLAELTNGTANLAITATGVTGTASGAVTVNVPGVAFSGNFTVTIDDAPASLTVVGNPVTLTVSGLALTGSFGIERTTTSGGEQVLKISATGVGATLGSPAVVTMAGGSGALIVRSAGLAGRVSGGVTIAAGPIASSATFDLIVNTTPDAINETFAVGGALVVPAGPYVRFAGSGVVTVTVSGAPQTLSGSFAFEKTTRSSDATSVVRLAATGVTASFRNGATTLAELTGGEGFFVFEAGGVAGRFSGSLAVTLPGVSLSATASLEVSTLATAVSESIDIAGATLSLDVPAGPFFRFTASDAILIAAGQKVRGDFTFTKSGANVSVAVSGLEIEFGDGAGTFVTARAASASLTLSPTGVAASVNGASLDAELPGVDFGGTFSLALDSGAGTASVSGAGSLTVLGSTIGGTFTVQQFTTAGGQVVKVGITGGTLSFADGGTTFVSMTGGTGDVLVDAQGVAADFSANVAVNIPGGFNASASAKVQINTRAAAVTDLGLPGGPFVRVLVDNLTLNFAGSTISGDFAFDQTTRPGGAKITRVAVNDLTIASDGNGLTNGEGAFVLLPAAGAAPGGLAGFANGTVTGPGLSGSGGVRINKSGLSVEETITVGGRSLTIRFDDGETELFSFFAENLSLNIGDFIVIQGSIGFTSTPAKDTFAGEGIELYFGRGPPRLPNNDLNPLAQGVLLRDATIGLIRYNATSTYALVAMGTVELVGVSGVTFSGTALVRVNTTTSAVDELLTFGADHEVPVMFSAMEVAGATPFAQFTATNLEIAVGGQKLMGDFSFAKGANEITVTASNVTAAFGDGTKDLVKLSEGSGSLILNNAGIAARLSVRAQIDVPGVAFDGTVGLLINNTAAAVPALTLPAGPYLRVAIGEATAASLTIAGQAISGKFVVEQVRDNTGATVTRIAASEVTLNLGIYVNVTNGRGSIVVRASGVAASLAADVALSVPGATLTGTFGVSINTTGAAVSESFIIGGDTIALDLSAGPYLRVEARGVDLTVASQRVFGDFAFERVTRTTGTKVTRVVIANAGFTLTDGTTPIAALSNATGAFVLDDAATGLAGTISGDVSVNIPGVALSGALSLQLNDTTSAISESFTVNGTLVELSLPAGKFLRIAGSGVSLTVPGGVLNGDFVIEKTTNTLAQTRLHVGIQNARLALGGDLVRVEGASANFIVSAAGIAGNFAGSVIVNVPDVSFTGVFDAQVNTTGAAVNETLTGIAPALVVDAGQFVRVKATGVSVVIAGQTLTGNFTIEKSLGASGGVKVALANTSLALGDGTTTYVAVTGASGAFVVGAAGVAGSISASNVSITIPGIDPITASVTVEVNTTTLAVTGSIPVGAGSITLDLPAGPFVRVAVLDLTARIGTVSLIGDFYFERSVGADGAVAMRFAVADASITVGTDGIKNAEGAFIVKGGGATGGFAGILTGDLAVAASGVNVSGRAGFRINSFATAINDSVTIGGRTIPIVFSATEVATTSAFINFFAEDLVLNIGNFVTIEGTVNFVNNGGRSTFAGANLLVFMGQGPARLASGDFNPTATGVLVSDARVGLIRTAGGYALSATGLVQFVGISGVTIAGQATVLVNTTGTIISETLTFPGDENDPGIALSFPTVDRVTKFEVLNGELAFAGQTLKGDISFDKVTSGATNSLRIAMANGSLDLGDGALAVSDIDGALLLTPAGVAGRVSASVAVNVPNVSLSNARWTFAINSTAARVTESVTVGTTTVSFDVQAGPYMRVELSGADSINPAALVIAGQSIQGEYAFERFLTADGTPVVRGAATNVSIDIVAGATPIATVRNGEGAFVITTAGLTGRISGTVAITPPGGSFTGDFSLAVNSTALAVDESFNIGTKTVQLTLPAGPYVRVEALNARLTFQGVNIAGDFAFEQATSGAVKVVSVALTSGNVQLGDGLVAVTDIEGALLINGTALAGSLTASVALNVPSVSFSGDVSLLINTGAAPVNTTFTVGSRTVTLNVPGGPYVQFTGTNLALSVAGQTLRGDFTFEQQTIGAQKIVRVAAANVVLSLGGPPAILTATGGGNFLITPAGFAGEVNVTITLGIPNVDFSGAFKLRINNTTAPVNETFKIGAATSTLVLPAGPFVRVEGTGVSLAVMGQTLSGNFAIEQTTGLVRVGLSNVSLSLGSGLVNVTNGSGFLLLTTAGVAARFGGTVAVTVPNVAFSGAFTVEINNTFDAVNQSIAVGGGVQTLSLPAGPFLRVTGEDVSLRVVGQTLRGSFTFEQVATKVRVGVRDVSLALGDGAKTFLSVTNGAGVFVMTPAGLAGRVSGDVAVTIPNVELSASLAVAINNTNAEVNETFDVAGIPTTLTLPAGPFVRVEGNGVSAMILGQRLGGNFSFEATGTVPNRVVSIAASNVSLALGDGTTDFVTLTNGSGAFVIRQAGIAGQVSGTVAVNIPDVTFSAGLRLQINTTGAAVNQTFTVGGVSTTLTLPAGNYVQVATLPGQPAMLTVLGLAISAEFTIQKTTATVAGVVETQVSVAINNLTLQIKDGATTFVNVTNGTGALLVTRAGVAASFTVSATLGAPGVFTVTGGAVSIQINTATQPVDQTYKVGATDVPLVVPAGPFIRVVVIGANVTIGNETAVLTGDFFFDQTTRADATKVTRVAVNNVTVAVAGQSLKNGAGAFVILPTGFAGFISGDVAVATGSLEVGGSIGLRVNKTGVAVDETIELNGRTFVIQFPDGTSTFSIFVAGLSIRVGDFVEIEGESISFTSTPGGDTLVASGVSVFMGQGPVKLSADTRNPAAQGVLLSNARVGVLRLGATGAYTYAVYAEGTIEIIGFSGFTFTGSATVRFNNTSADRTVSFPKADGTNDTITITSGTISAPTASFVGDLSLAVAGQSLSGTFGFEQQLVGGVKVTKVGISDANLSIGDGTTEFLSVTNGTGGFIIKPTGIAGRFAATVAVNPALGFTFSAGLSVEVNTTMTAVNDTVPVAGAITLPAGPYLRLAGDDVTLTVAGQSLMADFAIERFTKTDGTVLLRVAATDVQLHIKADASGPDVVTLADGEGFFVVSSAGIAGRVGGTVTFNIPDVTFTGTFTLAVNSTPVAVNESIVVGGRTITLALPSGPFLRVEGTDVSVRVAGQTLGGDFAFERVLTTTGMVPVPVVRVVIANAHLSLGDGTNEFVSLTNGEGAFISTPTSFAGSIGGTIRITVPGVTFGGDFRIAVNTATTAVNETFKIGERTFALTVQGGPFMRIEGTGASIEIAGQKISGDFAIEQLIKSNGQRITRLAILNGSINLGDGLVVATNLKGAFVFSLFGVAGEITTTLQLNVAGGLLFAGRVSVRVNNTIFAVNESIAITTAPGVSETITLALPAGPYLRVDAAQITVSIAGQE